MPTRNRIKLANPPVIARSRGQGRVFCVYIDGSNLYHRIRACGIDESNFDYRGFVDWLVGVRAENVRYYVGQILYEKDNPKALRLYANQQKRFARFKHAGFYLIRGRMLKIGDKYVEKGVDVRMGVDIATGALEDLYDKTFLLSSDGDLAPAIEHAIRRGGKEVVYVGIERSLISYHLIQQSSLTKIVKTEELARFGKKSEEKENEE